MKLEDQNAEVVDRCVYLRQARQMGNDLGVELSKWRANWIAFTKLREKKTSSTMKAELFNSMVLLVLLYKCEMWNTTVAEDRKLPITQTAIE